MSALAARPARIDPRGARVAAALTAVVLAAAQLAGRSPLGGVLLAWQVVVFAIGTVISPVATPYAALYRAWLAPRLAAPTELEDAAPPRFAQGVGLAFAATGLVAWLTGASVVGMVAVAFAFGAALLNAVFGICLGCLLYVAGVRLTARVRFR